MMFRVWNTETAKFAGPSCPMCEQSAMRIADALERATGDAHTIVQVL